MNVSLAVFPMVGLYECLNLEGVRLDLEFVCGFSNTIYSSFNTAGFNASRMGCCLAQVNKCLLTMAREWVMVREAIKF